MVDKNGNAVAGEYYYELNGIKFMDDVEKVSSSSSHCLALKKDGSVWAWGENQNGWKPLGMGKASRCGASI